MKPLILLSFSFVALSCFGQINLISRVGVMHYKSDVSSYQVPMTTGKISLGYSNELKHKKGSSVTAYSGLMFNYEKGNSTHSLGFPYESEGEVIESWSKFTLGYLVLIDFKVNKSWGINVTPELSFGFSKITDEYSGLEEVYDYYSQESFLEERKYTWEGSAIVMPDFSLSIGPYVNLNKNITLMLSFNTGVSLNFIADGLYINSYPILGASTMLRYKL